MSSRDAMILALPTLEFTPVGVVTKTSHSIVPAPLCPVRSLESNSPSEVIALNHVRRMVAGAFGNPLYESYGLLSL